MFVGFDTSNYTTSAALFDGETVIQRKKLLDVKPGDKGLRQSDAVFQHIVNMPKLINSLQEDITDISAVAVSTRPRNKEGSYMPCFLVGENTANAAAAFANCSVYKTSHQVGHILAALYSTHRLDLISDSFIAFHLSGGTTEALLVTPDSEEIIKADIIAKSSDLKAGQAIDRTGVMLGMNFPCGKELDSLAVKSKMNYKIKPSFQKLDCSLSGIENKAQKMFYNGEEPENIAKFVISYIIASIDMMLDKIIAEYGNMPVVFSGGVSSNSMLQNIIKEKYGALFASPEFSCDNAAGVAIYAYLKSK